MRIGRKEGAIWKNRSKERRKIFRRILCYQVLWFVPIRGHNQRGSNYSLCERARDSFLQPTVTASRTDDSLELARNTEALPPTLKFRIPKKFPMSSPESEPALPKEPPPPPPLPTHPPPAALAPSEPENKPRPTPPAHLAPGRRIAGSTSACALAGSSPWPSNHKPDPFSACYRRRMALGLRTGRAEPLAWLVYYLTPSGRCRLPRVPFAALPVYSHRTLQSWPCASHPIYTSTPGSYFYADPYPRYSSCPEEFFFGSDLLLRRPHGLPLAITDLLCHAVFGFSAR